MRIRNSAKAIIIQGEKVLLTKNQDNDGYFYPALTGSKTPTSKLEKIKKRRWEIDQLPVKARLVQLTISRG